MSQTRFNKTVTITNDEIYDLSLHMARLGDSISAVIRVASAAERDGLAALAPGGILPIPTNVARSDLYGAIETWDGTRWVLDQREKEKFVAGTATGNLPVASGWIPIAADYTTPVYPFGVGVAYSIEVDAQCAPANGAGGATAMRVLFNAATANGGQGQTDVNATGTLYVKGNKPVTDGSAQTISVQVSALTAQAVLSGGTAIYWYKVTIKPIVVL